MMRFMTLPTLKGLALSIALFMAGGYALSTGIADAKEAKTERQSASSLSCYPSALLVSGETLQTNQVRPSSDGSAYIVQQDDGNLVVRRGTRDNPGDVIFASGAVGSTEEYHTVLQSDGNLISWHGTPSNRGSFLWKTDSASDAAEDDNYFLGVGCDGTHVALYTGTPDNPGDAIWPSCILGSLLLSGDTIVDGASRVNPIIDAYVQQQHDGNLVVRRGKPESPGNLVWASGTESQKSAYYTHFQGNGKIVIRQGRSLRGSIIWETGAAGDRQNHYLGLNCNGSISIYANNGSVLWTS